MEPQSAQEFKRGLVAHHDALRRKQSIVKASQQKSERRAARQYRQYRKLDLPQRTHIVIGRQQTLCLGDVKVAIGLEAPGIEAHCDVIGQNVGAGEVEVDQSRQPIAKEKYVIGKQIGMDDARRKIFRPTAVEGIQRILNFIGEIVRDVIGAVPAILE